VANQSANTLRSAAVSGADALGGIGLVVSLMRRSIAFHMGWPSALGICVFA
jgi:hypothetical protein